jgi:hypothetical protein
MLSLIIISDSRAEVALSSGMKMGSTVLFEIPLSTVTAFARLGETPDQCQMRYGNPNRQEGPCFDYYKDHFDIDVLFRDGKSVRPSAGINSWQTAGFGILSRSRYVLA